MNLPIVKDENDEFSYSMKLDLRRSPVTRPCEKARGPHLNIFERVSLLYITNHV